MLYLLQSPTWATPDHVLRPLPVTVPAALLIVLGSHAGWISREQLALIFWPDAAPSDALHHLRINLHRARGLLVGWGVAEALEAERSRVRLNLPSDLTTMRAAQQRGDGAVLSRLDPTNWLDGWRLRGYDGFAQWCDDTALRLKEDWLAAYRQNLHSGVVPATQAPPGREREWQELLAIEAPAALLLGEPGAGKTTLLRSAWPAAPCLRGLEGLHAMPYRALLDALRERQPQLQRAMRDFDHPLRPYRLDLTRVLPELGPEEVLPPLDALTARSRLIEALTRAFEALSPVLLIDDLQWCDGATVEWLLMLAHTGRLKWRATARHHEIGSALHQSLQRLRSAALLREMTLLDLDGKALERLCRKSFSQQDFSPAQLAHLLDASGGNVLLVVELVRAGVGADELHTAVVVQDKVAHMVKDRIKTLPPRARQVVEAAAVFVEAVPRAALGQPAEMLPQMSHSQQHAWSSACNQALAAGLLRAEGERLSCRHDLIRTAVSRGISAPRRRVLHRHAAKWLAMQSGADPLTIAEHWRAAGEPQTAMTWSHRGAEQLKARGRFVEAVALWGEVADGSVEPALTLRSRLELAACDLLTDLARGEAALNAVEAQLVAVTDAEQHRQLEGRLKAALVDNRVFAGDLATARVHAARLHELLNDLPQRDQTGAIEALIELSMREPDISGAWALLARLRSLVPQAPLVLSFEGQIYWFGGQVQAAHDVLSRLLERHPDYCQALTIENDLATMLQALGRIGEAEVMARRSLQSWAGVAHTETLSLLALGLTLTSAGRYEEADAALLRALDLAREQASAGFEAEARVRRARLLLRCGDAAAAQLELDIAAPLLRQSSEPLRVSQLALTQVQATVAAGQPSPVAALERLQDLATRSKHPLVHARLAWANSVSALVRGDSCAAREAARQQGAFARSAGLQEVLAEALWLEVQAVYQDGAPETVWQPLATAALTLAERQGCGGLAARLEQWLVQHRKGGGLAGSAA